MARPTVVDLLVAGAVLHPHVAAARSTAEGAVAVHAHLCKTLNAGDAVSDLSWRVIDTVVPAKVAGVVIGDCPECWPLSGLIKGEAAHLPQGSAGTACGA